MQPSCPGLSLVMRAGLMVMTLRQSNSPPNWKVQTHCDWQMQDRWRAKSRALHPFLWHQGDCSQRISPLGQTVNSAYNCDVLWRLRENVQSLNFDDKRIGCCIMTMHCLTLPSSPGNFWPKITWLLSFTHPTHLIWPHATFLCFFPDRRQNWKEAILTQLKWSRKNRRWCWTPSQNTNSRMHLQNGRSIRNGAYMRKGTTSSVMVGSRPKVSLWPECSISSGNCGNQYYEYVKYT
jgi:hypothetical protein